MKNLLYYIVVISFGAWLIYQLYDSPQLHNIKADIESYHYKVIQMKCE